MGEKKKVLALEIDKDLWEKFKDRIHRNTKLNDAVVRLISTFVYEDKFEINLKNIIVK